VGIVYFTNDIVVPEFGASMGTETGHCIQVSDTQLACYFNFKIKTDKLSGRILAEALFDLPNFPNANLVITGGTGDFLGASGHGCTTTPKNSNNVATVIYNFSYKLM
jgi:hypothetical protein